MRFARPMTLTLIGLRGTGKSSVAPLLAARLGCHWVDADEEIAARAGCSIADIFARRGESEFRRLEAEVLADLLPRGRIVVSTGGGAILNPATRKAMRAAGPVVWLQASPDSILRRIGQDLQRGGSRPALTPLDPRPELEQLLAQRAPLYAECATMTIDTDALDVDHVVAEILRQLPLTKAPQ